MEFDSNRGKDLPNRPLRNVVPGPSPCAAGVNAMVLGALPANDKKDFDLSDEAEGQGIAVEPPFICAKARKDHQDQIGDGQGRQKNKADKDKARDQR